MSTTTTRLGLVEPIGSESFNLGVWNGNSAILDSFPGVRICANASAVTSAVSGWGSAHAGMVVFNQDSTDAANFGYWRWNGSALVPLHPAGSLAVVTSTTANQQVTGTSSGSPTTLLSSSVNVKPTTHGGSTARRLRINVSLPGPSTPSTGYSQFAIQVGSTIVAGSRIYYANGYIPYTAIVETDAATVGSNTVALVAWNEGSFAGPKFNKTGDQVFPLVLSIDEA